MVENLNLIALKNGDINKFCRAMAMLLFNHQQAWSDGFNDKTKVWQIARNAPNLKLYVELPNTEMAKRGRYPFYRKG